MNSRWVKPTEELPSSGFFVQCRRCHDLPPAFFVAYGSYRDILETYEKWFSPEELKLVLWRPQCSCDNPEECGLCDAAEFHCDVHVDICTMEVSVGRMGGAFKLDDLDRYGTDCEGDVNPVDDVWRLADLYQAAYIQVHGSPVFVTDEEAYDIMWDGADYKEFFQSLYFF